MPSEKVAVVTNVSQGLGARLVRGFRNRGYGVAATSRSMRKIDAAGDPSVLVINGDIAVLSAAERIIYGGIQRLRRLGAVLGRIPARPESDAG